MAKFEAIFLEAYELCQIREGESPKKLSETVFHRRLIFPIMSSCCCSSWVLRSLDPFFEDYIELNDLNVPLELRRDQVDDLMPTIKEGKMSSMQEDIQCAGSDTRPPMLDRTDFESWQQRIRLYCLGKDNGENIMKSIKEGPFHMGTVSNVIAGGTEGAVQQGPVRARVLNDLSAEEKERYKADIRATNILLQGIPCNTP
ncbi:hypothetical protein Tco_1060835 [Tanacetum coccineum]